MGVIYSCRPPKTKKSHEIHEEFCLHNMKKHFDGWQPFVPQVHLIYEGQRWIIAYIIDHKARHNAGEALTRRSVLQ
jgi:hypothetical protein